MGGVRVTGNPERLPAFLAYLQGPEFLADSSAVVAATLLKDVQDGFNRSRDPYQEPWKKLRYRQGKPLQKTGRMYRSTAARALPGGGAEVGVTADYAIYHQDGTRRRQSVRHSTGAGDYVRGGIDKRAMVPDDRGLPDKWGRDIDSAVERLVDRKEGTF